MIVGEGGVLMSGVGIHKTFRGPAGELEILRGINLDIAKGYMCFIGGRSGAGKSTLLHILAALDRPTQGAVHFRGKDLAKAGEKEISRYRNEKMGFIFQFYHLLPELTVLENVCLPALMAKRKNQRTKALGLLQKMGLEERALHLPSQLSGGEKQRAAIARSLINDPEIVFCDEPTGNLDDETAEHVFQVIMDLNRRDGQTFCIVTHEESLVASGKHVYHLHEGRLALKRAAPLEKD